jgi:hypothetical protein
MNGHLAPLPPKYHLLVKLARKKPLQNMGLTVGQGLFQIFTCTIQAGECLSFPILPNAHLPSQALDHDVWFNMYGLRSLEI